MKFAIPLAVARGLRFWARRFSGQWHVSMTPEQCRDDFRKRMRKGAWEKLPPEQQELVLRLCRYYQRQNRGLYAFVMGGIR